MSEPLTEQITLAVQTIIAGVTASNGSTFDVVECARATMAGGYQMRHGLVVLEEGDFRNDEANAPMGKVRRILPLMAMIHVRPDKGDTVPVDTYCNRALAELDKALMADQRLGGLAQSLTIGDPIAFKTEDGTFAGVALNFEVAYRHSATDPFTPA